MKSGYKIKRFISLILVLALCAGLTACSADSDLVKGSLKKSAADRIENADRFYYSDAYLGKSGKQDDEHLLTMSFYLAISTFETSDSACVAELYKDIGFNDVSVADMSETPTKNTVGTAIARKTIGDKNVIAVAIRGGNYGSEWASNFTVGKTGNAKGFDDACVKVIDRIKAYIAERDLTDNKIWIAGYSRAGAIADLAGVYINRNLSEFSTTADDIYIYAFEPPTASADETVFDNIYIVINRNDIVPYVCPKEWGFHTNGKIIYIERLQTVTAYTDLLSPVKYKSVAVDQLLSDSIEWFAGRISREKYVDTLEEPLCELLELFFDKPSGERSVIVNFFTGVIFSLTLNPDKKAEFFDGVTPVLYHNSDYLYRKAVNALMGLLGEARNASGTQAFTDEEFEILKTDLYRILRVLGPVIVDDMHYYDGGDYEEYYAEFMPDYNMGDYDLGYKRGESAGMAQGYSDGFNDAEYDPEPHSIEDYGQEYVEGYTAAYKSVYAAAYDSGKARENYTEENVSGAGETAPEVLDSYHVLSVFKNIFGILGNHYVQPNLKFIQARDSYYR